MARFLFLSAGSPAHVDYGGLSFLRTAACLAERGHEVEWAVSHPSEAIRDLCARLGVPESPTSPNVDATVSFHLTPWPEAPVIEPIERLTSYLRGSGTDVLVSDCCCSYAALPARLADVPWVTVGTDGRKRKLVLTESGSATLPGEMETPFTSLCERFGVRDLEPCASTAWLTSPYLSLCFLPAEMLGLTRAEAPATSHFLGCAEPPPAVGPRDRLLLLGGASWHGPSFAKAAAILPSFLAAFPEAEVLFVTSRDSFTKRVSDFLQHPRFRAVSRMEYAPAFEKVRAVIGHGSSHFAYQAIRSAAASMVLSPWIGDQVSNAIQLAAAGAGIHLPGPEIDDDLLLDEFERLWTDETLLAGAARLSRALHAGGGVPAAAALLERLAVSRAPVTRCLDDRCCC